MDKNYSRQKSRAGWTEQTKQKTKGVANTDKNNLSGQYFCSEIFFCPDNFFVQTFFLSGQKGTYHQVKFRLVKHNPF